LVCGDFEIIWEWTDSDTGDYDPIPLDSTVFRDDQANQKITRLQASGSTTYYLRYKVRYADHHNSVTPVSEPFLWEIVGCHLLDQVSDDNQYDIDDADGYYIRPTWNTS